MTITKETFLTVAEFPKYEINGHLVIRNKRTKRVVNFRNSKGGVPLRDSTGKLTYRSPVVLYRFALPDGVEWFPIPSLPNYEITKSGNVRHVKTRRPVVFVGCMADFGLGKSHVHGRRSKASLLNEVFGKPQTSVQHHVPCTLQRGSRRLFFDTMTDACRFLIKDNFYSLAYTKQLFARRQPVIFGWNVTYLDQDDDTIQTPTLKKLGGLANHQRRAHRDAIKQLEELS